MAVYVQSSSSMNRTRKTASGKIVSSPRNSYVNIPTREDIASSAKDNEIEDKYVISEVSKVIILFFLTLDSKLSILIIILFLTGKHR